MSPQQWQQFSRKLAQVYGEPLDTPDEDRVDEEIDDELDELALQDRFDYEAVAGPAHMIAVTLIVIVLLLGCLWWPQG